jgi:signal peptidase I
MDRKLARKNIRSGLIAGALVLIMFGLTFVAAAVYVHP